MMNHAMVQVIKNYLFPLRAE